MHTVDLSTPLTLKCGVTVKNRFFKSAMSEQLGDRQHNPKPGLQHLYRIWAEGGAGISVSGNIMIDRNFIGEPGNVVLDKFSDLAAFSRWTAAGKTDNTQFWAQLNHPGKQINRHLCSEPVAPSAIPLGGGLEKSFNPPRMLTEKEILNIIEQFADCARLCKLVGFSGVQIHAAHGYLVNQFLSPRHNQRDDRWGGDIYNRMRFLLDVYQAIRREVGADYPVSIKLNSADFMHGGFSEDESLEVVQALTERGIDHIEISGGTYESPVMAVGLTRESTRRREAYFLEFAEKICTCVDTPLAVTGGFRSAAGMQRALESGATDFIGIARPMAIYPDLPNHAMANKEYKIELRRLTTGFATIDRLALLNIYWYEHQMQRMAKNKKPHPDMSEWRSFIKTFCTSLCHAGAFKKKRVVEG
ncbi:NADH:flavin oxidoreductase/NADH oxidase family protein [Xenorhabdus bovienii]|uniref:NADH:flavin oxidoreductase/NADH oxidase family protein n=1 Tax=Xenorhabdus bovienii TaxID=40576 RepID=UPI0023B2FB82|nr:NADH:flavin oxidoreductase/NADH oxidase family protein [Xenorhabdus bovienii]MDE9482422.1 NADH:flavin oxidoreductase/NADH oxidase family protein [Xenorhabdus bovienii]MDE9556298.1 NADH:flavin oxidoreductase/NADH oxidase family protein [Xenorhabdus bovienii]